MAQNFSSREGITSTPAEITIRYDAPEGLRIFLFDTLLNRLKIGSQRALYIISGILLEPTEGNWTPDFVKDEIRRLLTDDHRCPWNKIYDIIEAFHSELNGYAENQRLFTEQINGYFHKHGIGWELEDGQVMRRGDDDFEQGYKEAIELSHKKDLPTTAEHLKEARNDLSRRPEPDTNGAVTHAYQAIECLSREVVGGKKETLGELLKKNPDLFPSPLNQALAQVWGFVSNTVRHPREREGISIEEVELLVGIIPPLAKYLLHKFPEKEDDPLPF